MVKLLSPHPLYKRERSKKHYQRGLSSSPWSNILSIAYLYKGEGRSRRDRLLLYDQASSPIAYGWVGGAIHSFSSRIAGLPKHLHVLVVIKHSTLVLADKAYFMKRKVDRPDPMCLPPANLPHSRRRRKSNRKLPSHRVQVLQ